MLGDRAFTTMAQATKILGAAEKTLRQAACCQSSALRTTARRSTASPQHIIRPRRQQPEVYPLDHERAVNAHPILAAQRVPNFFSSPGRQFRPLQQQCKLHTSSSLNGRKPDRIYGPSGRPYPNRPPRSRYDEPYPFDHEKARNARPILTTHQVRNFFYSPRLRYGLIIVAGATVIFYYSNLETVPVSGRRRFNCFTAEQAEIEGQMAYKQILNEALRANALLPRWDPRVQRVEKVLERLIEGGNLGTGTVGQETGWAVHVIDDPHQANAFVLPGGKVFVFTGLLPICKNNNGLAAVLGHEIAHNIALHSCEKMSSMLLLQIPMLFFTLLDFTGFTYGLGQYLGSLVLDLGLLRPNSRAQESEADKIGLMLMADSCFDPKEAKAMWERMEKFQKTQGAAPAEFLSTHPSNRTRIDAIEGWLPEAESKWFEKGCANTAGYMDAFQHAVTKPIMIYA